MKKMTIRLLSKGGILGILALLIGAFGGIAVAQCGVAFDNMALAASLIQTQSKISISPVLKGSVASNAPVNPSIVGLWHIRFLVGGNEIQEAFQIWNTGGTEAHNPKVDPRTGNICLGTWTEAPEHVFRLNHRVWLYDPNGNFQGVGFLTESITLGDRGATQRGEFLLEIHDTIGNITSIPGTVTGERITVDGFPR